MRKRLVAALAIAVGTVAFMAPTAFGAATTTKTLTFPVNGQSTTDIFSKSFDCCAIVVPELGIDANINGGVDFKMKTTMTQGTQNDLTFTDTNLRQGRTLDLTNTFTNGTGSLDVDYMFSGHLSLYGIGFELNKSEGVSIGCKLPFPTTSCSNDKNIELLSYKPIDVLVGYVKVSLDAVISTTAALSGNGLTTHRTLTVDGADVKPPTDLNFNATPQTIDESTRLSCALPTNAPVNYAMGDESGAINGQITEGLGVGISGGAYLFNPIPGSDDILLVGVGPFNLPGLVDLPPLTMTTINLTSPGQNVDLGVLQANNIAPTVALDTIPSNGVEGHRSSSRSRAQARRDAQPLR